MKSIKVNDIEIFQISNTDEELLGQDLLEVDAEINRRMQYIIDHKVDQCFKRMKEEWVDSGKLEGLGVTSIPTNRDELVALITAQPDYMTKAQKIAKDIADKEATQQKEI